MSFCERHEKVVENLSQMISGIALEVVKKDISVHCPDCCGERISDTD